MFNREGGGTRVHGVYGVAGEGHDDAFDHECEEDDGGEVEADEGVFHERGVHDRGLPRGPEAFGEVEVDDVEDHYAGGGHDLGDHHEVFVEDVGGPGGAEREGRDAGDAEGDGEAVEGEEDPAPFVV